MASILGLIALSIVQGYLINNTYKLKKEAFITETRRSISQIDDFSPTLDSLASLWQDTFLNTLADYKAGTANKDDILIEFQLVIDSINEPFKSEYQEELAKKNIAFGVKFHKKVEGIILLDSIKNDTLFNSKKTPRRIILGDSISDAEARTVGTTLWSTDHTSNRIVNGETKKITFDIAFQTRDVMDIVGWKKTLFKRMTGLLLMSLLIFSLVIALLYYSIKSLITQKKIADVKTDFINNITHELKTPLATLSLATKMLKNEDMKQQPQFIDNTVNTIERQNTRLQKLIDQVLNNSLGYKEIQLHKEQLKIDDYIHTILDDFSLSVKTKKVEINRAVLKSDQTISIDKFYITTALFNILENAVKYSGDDIKIDCKTFIDDHFIISITDNGIGISEKDQKQLFDKFYRVGNKEVHDVKGLGLGLYYTNQIIKAHQGHITIRSSKGKGTTFKITLPLNQKS